MDMTDTVQSVVRNSWSFSEACLNKIKPTQGHATMKALACVTLAITLGGCSAIKSKINDTLAGDHIEVNTKDVMSPTYWDGYQNYPKSHFMRTKESKTFNAANGRETRDGMLFCYVDPKVSKANEIDINYSLYSDETRNGKKLLEKPTVITSLNKSKSGRSNQSILNKLRQMCLKDSGKQAERDKNTARAIRRAELSALKSNSGNFHLDDTKKKLQAYANRAKIKGEFSYIPAPLRYQDMMKQIKSGNITKGMILNSSVSAGYRIQEPTSEGYLYMTDANSRKQGMPFILNTDKKLQNNYPHQESGLVRFDGLTTIDSAVGATIQTALFTQLNDK